MSEKTIKCDCLNTCGDDPSTESDASVRCATWQHNRDRDAFGQALTILTNGMSKMLQLAHGKGMRGCMDKQGSTQRHLSNLLREHVEKGDPVDVANFCMMLHARGERIAPRAAARQAQAGVDSLGTPLSCGKPLCSPDQHHPLCKLAAPQRASAQDADDFAAEARALVRSAQAAGYVITIEAVPLKPLAMGNSEMSVSVRQSRAAQAATKEK